MLTLPGARIKRYLGRVNLHFIRETLAVQKEGGLASFFFVLLQQTNAIARANVRALGGNALVGYRMNPRESSGGLSTRKAYHMVSVSGDAVELVYTAPHVGMGCMAALTKAQHHSSAPPPLFTLRPHPHQLPFHASAASHTAHIAPHSRDREVRGADEHAASAPVGNEGAPSAGDEVLGGVAAGASASTAATVAPTSANVAHEAVAGPAVAVPAAHA